LVKQQVVAPGDEPSRLTGELVARLRELRHRQQMSARELAVRCTAIGVPSLSRSTIAKIESGVRSFVTVEEAAALAMALGVTPADLLRPELEARIGRMWNVPARNPGFTGRDDLLAAVRKALLSGDRAVVQALHGMGGVGKTQLAAEYAHRLADEYDLVVWISAERAGLIGEQFAALADALGCAPADAELAVAGRAVLAELRERDRWLLVFDNAGNPAEVAGWLPGGSGHVLITSRTRGWTEIAVPVEIDVLAREDSVAILHRRVAGLADADAGRVAEALGDLPLAIAQAAAYMAGTGISAREYLDLLAARASEILDQGRPSSYPRSLAAVTQLAVDQLRSEDPAAAKLAGICAFLAPEPIPPEWFTKDPASLPAPLNERAADRVAWHQVLALTTRHALARIDHNGLQMHRLTQAIVRAHMPDAETAATRSEAGAILASAFPGDPNAPDSWPGWARFLPHLLALDPAASSSQVLRDLACDAARYLFRRGEVRPGYDLASRLYEHWQDPLGPDDSQTLRAAAALGVASREIGRYGKARQLDEDTWARRRRVLGDDHPETLTSADSLAVDLHAIGDLHAARQLHEATLARRRQILGEDHLDTLASVDSLAVDLYAIGEVHAARELDEDTLARRRRILGEDHPDTLWSASKLAADLRALGDLHAARELDEDTLARRRRVLGEDHPDTLWSASNLAADLRDLGDPQGARHLDEDTWARRRRVLGEDHPGTLWSASKLAADLRALDDPKAARELDEATWARRRQILGDDHPHTLGSARNLADDLRALGDPQAARELDEDTWARRRRVLGEDHPHTLRSASNLAADLRALGDPRAARELDEDTLARRRQILGLDHPDTLWSASNLAHDLRALGDLRAARELDEDTWARRRRVLGEDHPDTLWSARNLAADPRADRQAGGSASR
jgi:transcriptional regulator with XRE-family HTH domain